MDSVYIWAVLIVMSNRACWWLGPKRHYSWRLTPQNKAFSNQNKGHLGSRYIIYYFFLALMVNPKISGTSSDFLGSELGTAPFEACGDRYRRIGTWCWPLWPKQCVWGAQQPTTNRAVGHPLKWSWKSKGIPTKYGRNIQLKDVHF